jgi:hypothetical protein
MASMLDWGSVEAAIKQQAASHELSSREQAFAMLSLVTILRIDGDEARGCVTDGPADRGVDAVYLDERAGRRIVHLFQFKCHESYKSSKKNFPSTEIDKIQTFLTGCFTQVDGFLNSCNNLLKQKVKDIWNFVQNGGPCDIQIHLCSNGDSLTLDNLVRFKSAVKSLKVVSIIEHNLDSFSNALSSRSNIDRKIEIRAVDEQIFERTDGSVRALIATIRADDFINAFRDPANLSQLDLSLFEENVRIYLGEQNEINRKIYDTATSDEAGLFWYYNNGITIVCDSFEYQPGFRGGPLLLSNPQIVNGGQSSHALFLASRSNLSQVNKVRLLVRIFETKDRSLYAKVAEATNSQTPIRSRDLRSNEPVLIKLENSLRSIGYYLDRKRDQHSNVSTSKRIDALKLGQMWLAYVMGQPDKSKTASDKIFGEYFSIIFDPNEITAERAAAVWQLYEILELERRGGIDLARSATEASRESPQEFDTPWEVEGIFHWAFAVKRMAEMEGIDIFSTDEIKKFIPKARAAIGDLVNRNNRISFYRFFRSAATKRLIFDSSDSQLMLEFINY